MACFLAPVAEAIIVSVVKRNVEKKEKAMASIEAGNAQAASVEMDEPAKIPFSRKLKWLTNLLWGGSFLLLIEHIWHGEVVPWPPFLTAMSSPADTSVMLGEIATVGVTMAVLITAVWGVMVLMSNRLEKKAKKAAVATATEG